MIFNLLGASAVPQWTGRQLLGRRHRRNRLCTFRIHYLQRVRQLRLPWLEFIVTVWAITKNETAKIVHWLAVWRHFLASGSEVTFFKRTYYIFTSNRHRPCGSRRRSKRRISHGVTLRSIGLLELRLINDAHVASSWNRSRCGFECFVWMRLI